MRLKISCISLQNTLKTFLLLVLLSFFSSLHAQDIRIGVLAKRGVEKTLQRWQPMSDFLNERMPHHRIYIVALSFENVEKAIADEQINFILTNSSYYVSLELKYGVSPVATMYNRTPEDLLLDKFGGVIFTRSNRGDINSLKDIKGKRFAGVDELSFGGWQMALREFKKEGMNPRKDFSSLFFTQTHDAAVEAVLSGTADAGTARTDTLEKMVQEGILDLSDIKIINQKKYLEFPLLISTALYPEWPLAMVSGTSPHVAKELTENLFAMKPNANHTIQSGIGGWTTPADYKPVHDALKELNIGPYKAYKGFSLKDVFEKYWEIFIIAILVFIIVITSYFYLLRVQKITKKANKEIHELNTMLEMRVEERTKELHDINKTLEERIAKEVLESRKKDQAILVQSRYSAMGEMIGMLAHQWRQPIAVIQMGINNVFLDLELGIEDVAELKKELSGVSDELQKLSKIINDFSSKFQDDSVENNTKPQNVMDEVLSVMQSSLHYYGITLKKRYKNSAELMLISRQLFQVYLNVLHNAKEILIERDVSKPKIIIVIEENEVEVVTHICDNGGGIEEVYLERIFEPYFSTKEEKNGSGLGLYISKTIVEKQLRGTISAKNSGANICFTIRIPKNNSHGKKHLNTDVTH